MKKKYWILAIVLIILVIGYLGRHRIRTMLMGTPTPQPVTNNAVVTPTPSSVATASADLVITKSNSTKGNYLAGPNGGTLYIFDKDKPGVSNCSGSCAALWPPYTTSSVPSALPTNIATIKRADGSIQFTYKNMPLYYYTPDKQPGDVTGDGVGGVWHLVKP